MNGWRRLLIVIAAPFVLIGFAIGYGDANQVYSTDLATANADLAHLTGQAWVNSVWRENQNSAQFKHCVPETIHISKDEYSGSVTLTCENDTFHAFSKGLGFAVLTGLLFGLFGEIIGWIYRGFRPPA